MLLMTEESVAPIALPAHWFPYTKLLPPQGGKQFVQRTGLYNQFSQTIVQHKLILISAPAGSGKTVLAATLLDDQPNGAWIALDPTDDDVPVFVALFVTALEKQLLDNGQAILRFLQTVPYADEVVAQLASMVINQLQPVDDQPLILVLDDYHTIQNSAVHEFVTYLLDYAPPASRIIITTRHDPPLPLARWRMRGQLAEVRLDDLRFDVEETAVFLNQLRALQLSDAEVAHLAQHTEGWIAGLQLLASVLGTMTQQEARSSYIDQLGPVSRSIFDLLAAEVFALQPVEIQQFLLQTAVLPELTPEACTAVTQSEAVVPLLAAVYQRNLFLRALSNDSRLGPFRYHDLFADFLQQRLREENPQQWRETHQRAATVAKTAEQKLYHLQQAHCWDEAADLLEEIGQKDVAQRFVRTVVAKGIEQLPQAILEKRPWLSLIVAQYYSARGQLETAVPWWEQADRGFAEQENELGQFEVLVARAMTDPVETDALVINFRDKIERIGDQLRPDQWIVYHGIELWEAGEKYDWPQMTVHLNAVLRKALHSEDSGAMSIAGMIVTAPHMVFNLDGLSLLERFARQGSQQSRDEDHVLRTCAYGIAGFIHFYRGEINLAAESLEKSLKHLDQMGGRLAFVDDHIQWVALNIPLVKRAYPTFEAKFAEQLARSETHTISEAYKHGFLYLQGRTFWLQNRIDEAAEVFRQMEARAMQMRVPGERMRNLLLSSLLAMSAEAWRKAEEQLREADALYKQVRHTAFSTHPQLSLATLYGRQQRWDEALHTFRIAAAEIRSKGLPGIILQEGESIVPILERAVAADIEVEMIRPLLAILKPDDKPQPIAIPNSQAYLTPREAEVLQLLTTGATNPEIAAQLVITERTVKAHVTRILAKLSATTRTEAVAKATQLNLL